MTMISFSQIKYFVIWFVRRFISERVTCGPLSDNGHQEQRGDDVWRADHHADDDEHGEGGIEEEGSTWRRSWNSIERPLLRIVLIGPCLIC